MSATVARVLQVDMCGFMKKIMTQIVIIVEYQEIKQNIKNRYFCSMKMGIFQKNLVAVLKQVKN